MDDETDFDATHDDRAVNFSDFTVWANMYGGAQIECRLCGALVGESYVEVPVLDIMRACGEHVHDQ